VNLFRLQGNSQPLHRRLGDHPPVQIRADEGVERYLWDYLVHHHHYLGRPKRVGEYLKQVVGCLG